MEVNRGSGGVLSIQHGAKPKTGLRRLSPWRAASAAWCGIVPGTRSDMHSPSARPESLPEFPTRTIGLGLVLMLALLLASTALTWRLGNQIESAMETQVEILTAAGKVRHYGNVLKLSIEAVVNHADAEAAAEYRRIQPQLREVLTNLRQQVSDAAHRAAAAQVDRSDLELIALEYRALRLVEQRQMQAARRLIYSPRYRYLVEVYVQGVRNIEARAARYVENARWQTRLSVWLIVAMSAASLLLVIVGWAVLIIPARRWGDQLDQARSEAERSASLLEVKQLELQRLNSQLFQQARTDPLTGLNTRLKLNEDIAELWPMLEDGSQSASVMICDIDYFKQYNDSCGHLAGDEVLRRVGRALDEASGLDDQVYRLGGEEFLVLLRGCTGAEALVRAEAHRRSVERMALSHPKSPIGKVTVSVGVAAIGPGTATMHGWLSAADEAMYRAKSAGRNRVVASPPLAA